MHKLSTFTLCCALVLALSGCSSDKSADSGGTAANSAPQAAAPATPPPAADTATTTPSAGAAAEQKPQSPDGADKKPAAEGGAGKQAGKGETAGPKSGTEKAGKLVTTASGLQYEDITVGTGPTPQSGQQVTVDYTGTLADGTKFDSSLDRGQPFSFIIGQGNVIKGWDEGVMSMKVGGKRKLIIPADLAYGDSGAGGKIPPGATLTFIVELHGVQ